MSDAVMRALARELRGQGRLVDFVLEVIGDTEHAEDLAAICDAASAKLPILPGRPYVLATEEPVIALGAGPGRRVDVLIHVPGDAAFVCHRFVATSFSYHPPRHVLFDLLDTAADRIIAYNTALFGSVPMADQQFQLAPSTMLRLRLNNQSHLPVDVTFALVGRLVPLEAVQHG